MNSGTSLHCTTHPVMLCGMAQLHFAGRTAVQWHLRFEWGLLPYALDKSQHQVLEVSLCKLLLSPLKTALLCRHTWTQQQVPNLSLQSVYFDILCSTNTFLLGCLEVSVLLLAFAAFRVKLVILDSIPIQRLVQLGDFILFSYWCFQLWKVWTMALQFNSWGPVFPCLTAIQSSFLHMSCCISSWQTLISCSLHFSTDAPERFYIFSRHHHAY